MSGRNIERGEERSIARVFDEVYWAEWSVKYIAYTYIFGRAYNAHKYVADDAQPDIPVVGRVLCGSFISCCR